MINPEPARPRQSPIHQWHTEAGAKFANFGGWQMPLEYAGGGVLAEHQAVRTAAAIFDVSHLGKVLVSGPGAATYLNTRLTNDLAKIGPGRAQYTLLCNPSGGVVDDLIAYVRTPDEVLLIPNAANTDAVIAQLAQGGTGHQIVDQNCDIVDQNCDIVDQNCDIVDQNFELAVFAVQGPKSPAVLAQVGVATDLQYMTFQAADIVGVPVTVCRTGYTGELGFELVVRADRAWAVWEALMTAPGLRPAGLAARDTLRTEMGYPLHGQDISADISPVQARLGWAVGWGKPDFDGATALRAERAATPSRTLRGLVALERGIPRAGMRVVSATGDEVGVVTSGTFSPTRKVGIALALIDSQVGAGKYAAGQQVGVQIRSRVVEFVITKPPFVAASPGLAQP